MNVPPPDSVDEVLRHSLEESGQRLTEQRAAVFRFLLGTDRHPTAEEVHGGVRGSTPGISLATVYKSLETLVGCGLARKLSTPDGPARYDGRTDHHHHARCLDCGSVIDVGGALPEGAVAHLEPSAGAPFRITGYRLELVGYCPRCEARPAHTR